MPGMPPGMYGPQGPAMRPGGPNMTGPNVPGAVPPQPRMPGNPNHNQPLRLPAAARQEYEAYVQGRLRMLQPGTGRGTQLVSGVSTNIIKQLIYTHAAIKLSTPWSCTPRVQYSPLKLTRNFIFINSD